MPFQRKICSVTNVDKVFVDVYKILNKLDRDAKRIETGEESGDTFNLPYGWKIICTPTSLEIYQNDEFKGFGL